jgi:hypothetical protein
MSKVNKNGRRPLEAPAGYYTEVEAAEKLKRRPSSLRRWRRLRIGPKVTYLMGQPIYSDESLTEYLESCERTMVRERSRRQRQPEAASA